MGLHHGIHENDLRKYSNAELAKMYSVGERTISRARQATGITKESKSVEFTEEQFRQNSRKQLAEILGTTEYYIKKYAKERGWRKS